MQDFWIEIYEHIKNKASQTVASCIGIAWGIFIMIILVGIGNAFESSIMKLFADFNSNCVEVYAGTISMPMHGGIEGANILFDSQDIKDIKNSINEIEYISPLQSTWSLVRTFNCNGSFEIRGVDEDYFKIKRIKIYKGRNLHFADYKENRMFVMIGENVESVMFHNCDCIGKKIIINDIPYTIVGVFGSSITAPNDGRVVYMSTQNFMKSLDNNPKFSSFLYTAKNNTDIKDLVKRQIGLNHRFKPADDKAVYISTLEEQLKAFDSLFSGIRYFLWFVGISTLVGGIIGISNIMVSNVRERRREIGIRKAIGANPNQIKMMILGESIAITLVAGIGGIVLGWIILGIICIFNTDPDSVLGNPVLDMQTTIFSMLIILISGVISGLKPAVTAASLQPIQALQTE